MVTAARRESSPVSMFEPEPTAMKRCFPSAENASDRVSCPPVGKSSRCSASPSRLEVLGSYGKRTTSFVFPT